MTLIIQINDMKNRSLILFFCAVFTMTGLTGQETDYGPGYQTIITSNPAFSGSSGDGMLRLSYFNFYPGNNYNIHSFYMSYDSYFPVLHGGAGFYLSNDYLGGIVNDLRGAFSYAYFLKADRDFYINAGLSAGFFRRGFNFGNALFPDEINPMGAVTGNTLETITDFGQMALDISTGFLFIWDSFFAGFSIAHLSEPDLGGNGLSAEKLKRKYSLHLAGDAELAKRKDLMARPLATLELQGNLISGGGGASFESKNLSVGLLVLADNNRNIDVQTGFSIITGRILFFYNYRFNVRSGNAVMPFSVIHQPGLAFILNNVEKRLRYKTINIPRM